MKDDLPKPNAAVDAVALGIVVIAASGVAAAIDLFERFTEWSPRHESWRLDEIAMVAMILIVAAAVFAWRRWRETERNAWHSLRSEVGRDLSRSHGICL